MAWRVHLTNQAIQHLHILPSKAGILAVWTRPDRVHYYNLENGILLNESTIQSAPQEARSSDGWQSFADSLTGAGTHYYLPFVRTRAGDIYATDDGKLRVYALDDSQFFMETDGVEEPLAIVDAQQFVAVDLDRALGTFVALDEAYRLHIYQQNIRVGSFEIGLKADSDTRPSVSISRGGSQIFATDGRQLVALDASGKVLKSLSLHYFASRLAISPTGGMVVTSDLESGVIRLYRSDSLILTHQKFAIDLLAEANQVQLLADLPPISTGISALAAHARGTIAFAMSGVVCVTDATKMDEVPRPRSLF